MGGYCVIVRWVGSFGDGSAAETRWKKWVGGDVKQSGGRTRQVYHTTSPVATYTLSEGKRQT